MTTPIVRTRYTVSEIIETQAYTLYTFGSDGYAILNNDYVSCTVTSGAYYKLHKGNYQRCYGDPEPLNMALRIEKQKEWLAS